MKIWNNYGSEHSMNLVMIGRFKTAADANQAKEAIDAISEQVGNDNQGEKREGWFSEAMMEVLRKSGIHTIGPAELEQFSFDVRSEVKGSEVTITTDEADVSGFLKVLIDLGARVEVFSGHNYPESARGQNE
ncbi:MAG: DUF6375 family protein [Verrucomicrobiota bacterium]